MIIHSIHAVNVLKYAKLDLDNLPEKGKIAVSGPNESGKTAIVETISFALFGRTFTNDPDNITRIIRWGESSCSVEMVFTAASNNSYTITRSVDKQGLHSAEFTITGEDAPFAIGPQAVLDEVINVCGFDFEQYLDSLYLAQMEITSSASQAETIKVIAGSAAIEAISDELRYEIGNEHNSISAAEQERDRIRNQIESLDVQEDSLPAMETEKNQFAEQINVHKEEVRSLQDTSSHMREAGTRVQEAGHALTAAGRDISIQQWQEHLTSLTDSNAMMRESVNTLEMESELRSGGELKKYADKLQSRLLSFEPVREQCNTIRSEIGTLLGERGSNAEASTVPLPRQQSRLKRRQISQRLYCTSLRMVLVAFILATILLGSGWWLLTQSPDSEMSVRLFNWLNQQSLWWGSEYLTLVRNAAIASLLITILLYFMSTRVKSRIKQGAEELVQINERLIIVRKQADLLDHVNDRPLPEVILGLKELDNIPLKTALENFCENNGSTFLSEQLFVDHQQQLNALLDDNASNVAALRESIATEVGSRNSLTDELHDKINMLDREIEDIRARQKEAAELQKIIEDMQPSLDDHRARIQVRETALKLAEGACSNIYTQFNKVLSKYTAIVMPRLTEGRYRQIQIDDKLRVRVFATEKNDFADLEELSSGTQRQIMLAMRMAISKALVEAGQQGRQFIILDEPFAFFDRERIRNTIKSLTDLDNCITQFWILTQEFESSEQFELNIECTRDRDEMILSG